MINLLAAGAHLSPLFHADFRSRLCVLDKRIKVLPQNLRPFDEGHLRRYRAVGPDFHDEFVVVGSLTDAGVLDLVLDADDRREAGIDGDDADLTLHLNVLFGHTIPPPVLDAHLDDEGDIIGESGDDVVGVDDFHILIGDDVGGLDDPAFVAFDAQCARGIAGVFHHQALDVEDDVGDILDDAGNRADFVLDALYLDAGDGATFQAG